ncbi:Ras-related protein Rab-13 [Dictyocoela muelleri]|nr:Ras-related protein Rab-13 [Dictyocoela muelleri]
MIIPEIPFKILILGESSVGKTSILCRFKDDVFRYSRMNTIGIDFVSKTIDINNKPVKLQIWDTAGQERFHSITKGYYRNANGIFLVFSMTDDRSFECIDRWYSEIKSEVSNSIPIFLVGNKVDMINDETKLNVYKKKADLMNIKYYQTSAYSGKNIDKLFIDMAKEMINMYNLQKSSSPQFQDVEPKSKKKCCFIN